MEEQQPAPGGRDSKTIEENKQTLVPVVTIDGQGLLAFTNQIELEHAATVAINNKIAPKHLIKKDRNDKILKELSVQAVSSALLLCKQYNLPQKSMNEMAFIEGKLTCYGSLVTALAQRHKQYGKKEEFSINEKQEIICVENKNLKDTVWAAVVRVQKKGEEHWTEYSFSMKDAAQAGLDKPKKRGGAPNPHSPWIKYTRDMLMHKARSRALKAEYASALEGIDYHEDIVEAIKEREVTETVNIQDSL